MTESKAKEKAIDDKLREFINDVGEQSQVITLIFEDKNKNNEEVNLDMKDFIKFIQQEQAREIKKDIEKEINNSDLLFEYDEEIVIHDDAWCKFWEKYVGKEEK